MIFKTFNNDIDKMSAKWGIFGRSFNDIGTAIVGRIRDINKGFQSTDDLIGSIKDSDSIWKRLYPSRESIKSQFIDVDTLYPKIDNDNFDFDKWINELNDIDKQVKAGTKSWQDYSNGLKDNQKWIAKWGQETEGQIRTEKDLIQANQKAREAAIAHNDALKQQTLGAKAAKVGMQALATAGNMVAMWAISEVIGFAVTSFNNFIHSAENAKKSAESFNSSITSLQSEFASNTTKISELNSEYTRLSKGVSNLGENISLTSDEYDTYKDLVSQISDIMPNLTVRFNEQGEKIGFATGKLKDLNEQYKTYKKNEAHRILTEGNENGETLSDIIKNYNNQNKVGLWSAVLNAFKAPFTGKGYDKIFSNEDLVKYLSDLRELGQRSQEGVAEALGESSQFSTAFDAPQKAIRNIVGYGKEDILSMKPDDFNAFLETLNTLIDKYSREIDSAASEIGNSLLLIAQDTDEYWGLDDKTQYVDTLLTSMSDDMLKTANILDESGKMNEINMRTFVNRTIKVLQDNEGGISNAFNELFKIDLDDETLNPIEIYEKVNSYIDTIYEALGFDEEEAKEGKKNLKILLGFEVTEDNYNDYQNALRYFNTRKTSPDNPFPLFDMDRQAELEAWSKENDVTQEELENLKKNGYSAKNSIEELTNAIIKMRKENAPDKLPFDNAWNQLKNNSGAFKDNDDTKDTANNLLELAEAGKLTVKAFEKTNGSDDFLTQTKLTAKEATQAINELVDSSKQLSELKKGIGTITSAYNEKKDSKSNTVSPDTLSSMYDTLGVDTWTKKDKKVWEEYKNAAGDASVPVKKLKKYQDELAKSYLNSGNFLSNLNDDNKDYYKTLLKEMGIKNAKEIVDKKHNQLLALEQIASLDFASASQAEIQQLENEILKTAEASKTLGAYVIQKALANNTSLDTSESINNLIALANQCGASSEAIDILTRMKANQLQLEGLDPHDPNAPRIAANIESTNKYLKERLDLITDINNFDDPGIPKAEIDPTVTNPKDKTKDTTKDKTQSTAKIFNWIETRISRLERRISKATSKAEASYRSFEKRAKSYSKAIKLTTDEIKAQEKAADKYHKKADKSKLSDNLKKKVRNGTIDIQKIKDEKTQKQVEEYQENWEKYLAHKDEADNLRQKKKQYRRDKIELENTKLDESNESLESENNLISENIDHSKERGQFDLSGNYKQQIANNQKQAGNIKEQNKNLEKLKKTVAEGSEAWNGYESRIQSNNESINSLKNSNAELAEAMYNLPIEERDSLLEEYDSKDELLNAKSENALSAGEKNQYSDEIIANIKSRQSVRQNAVEGTKDNVLSNIPAGGGNDVYDKIQSCISSGQPIGKDLISAVSGNPDLYYACKAYNEALLDKMLYDETAKADIQSQLSSQRDNIESSANEQLESISADETKLQADISKSEAAGLSQSKAQYTEQIRLSKEREKALQNEHSQLENWLNDMMAAGEITEGDEQYEETQNKLKNMDAEIVNCIADQIKFGTEIKEMDLSRLEKLASLLDVAKNRLAGLASLAEAHGHNASDDLIAEQIETSITDAKNYKDMMQEYREQLLDPENLTEWGISKNLMENVITLVDKGNVNGAKDLLKDNGIDIENLAGFQEYMNGLASSTSSCYSAMVEGEKHYDSLYQNRIDKLSEYLDGLQKEKDLKDRTLALEKARFALEKAKNNLTKKVWNGSQWVYTADTEAVQSAQEAYDNTAFDELTHSIQDAIEVLEKLMKSDNLYDDNGNLIKNPDAGSLVKTADDNYVSLTSAQQNNIPQSAMPVPQLNIQNTAVPDFTLPAVSGAGTVINNNFDKLELSLPNVNDNSKAYDLAMSLRNELMSLRTYSQQYNWNQ